jgi:hypothetical protein
MRLALPDAMALTIPSSVGRVEHALNPRDRSTDPNARGRASTERTNTVSIILQSTVGGFSAQFMRKLPLVEQAMRQHGLDPADFVISKDYASTATIPIIGPFFFNYSVYFGEATFTVTEPNDMVFLDYFVGRVLAADQPSEVPRRPGPISRLLQWMTQPV